MSEDRLEKAIDALKNEPVDPEKIEAIQKRVRQNLENGASPACREFRQDFPAYLGETLSANRRLLLEDHLGRCTHCRAYLAAMKGDPQVHIMPERRARRWRRSVAWAAAAAVVLGALYLGRHTIDTLLAPSGPVATVASLDGRLFLVPDGSLEAGDAINRNDVVRTAAGTHAKIRLADGSLVNVNESTEFSVESAWSGQSIQLKRGDIIVEAAKQRRGYLRVRTRDSLTSVKGTVFAVSSGLSGTLVSVIEGSVAVIHSGIEVLLSPGEQEATYPVLETDVQQAVSWSPDADTYIEMLSSLARIKKQIAELPKPLLPVQSELLGYMPAGTVAYGAMPNLGGTIEDVLALIEEQAAKNATFSQWWNSESGRRLELLVDRIQSITPHLGDEIVFGLAMQAAGSPGIPMVLAQIQPGSRSQLEDAIQMLNGDTTPFPLPYYADDTMLVVTDRQESLDWLIRNLGQAGVSPFTSAIAARYSEGLGWLLAVNLSALPAPAGDAPGFVLTGQIQDLILDQTLAFGIPENEMTVTFSGPRRGLASVPANAGSGGATEYISGNAIAAGYIATREPQQLFEDLLFRAAQVDPAALDNLDAAEARLGFDVSNDLAYAIGTESAFAVESVSTAGPAWTYILMVHDSFLLEDAIQKLVDTCNTAMADAGKTERILYGREDFNARTWSTLQPPQSANSPFQITWTYDDGYLVASSDRATALAAIATRNGGSPLVWSSLFRQCLPASATLHPSGFLWLNAKDALQGLEEIIQTPALQDLITLRNPVLVVLDANDTEIRAVSQTNPSNVLGDLLLLRGLSGSTAVQ